MTHSTHLALPSAPDALLLPPARRARRLAVGRAVRKGQLEAVLAGATTVRLYRSKPLALQDVQHRRPLLRSQRISQKLWNGCSVRSELGLPEIDSRLGLSPLQL